MWLTYTIIAVVLLVAELTYFMMADHFNVSTTQRAEFT